MRAGFPCPHLQEKAMLKEDILYLSGIPGVTGSEDAVADAVYARLKELVP